MKESSRRALALAPVVLLLLALVPILLAGDCAHPSAADLGLSLLVHRTGEEGTSIASALADTVRRYYFGWDGSYTNVALCALQPGLLSEGAYLLAPVLLLAGLCLSTAALTHALLRRWLGLDRWSWLGVTSALVLVTVLYQPSARDAFLLWSSGVYCTLSFSLTLLLFTCLIRLRLEPKHPKALLCAALLLAVLTGGASPLAALPALLPLTGYAVLCALRDRRQLRLTLPVWAVLLVSLLISVLSPGSRIARESGAGLPLAGSLRTALLTTWPNAQWNLHLPLIALLVGALPVLLEIPRRTRFSFPYPGLVTAAAVLAAFLQTTQAAYAYGMIFPGQVQNIIYDALPWLLLLTEGYWVGWFGRRRDMDAPQPDRAGPVKAALLIASIGLILSAAGSTSGQCLKALANGSARAFDTQVSGWIQTLSDPQTDPAEVTQLSMPPFLLYHSSLTDDPENFANTAYANYYGKTAVTALPPEGT